MKRILITRPQQQATVLYDKIKHSGFIPILCPTLEILPIENSQPLIQHLQQLNKFDLAIFISPNAVWHTETIIKQYWPVLPLPLKFVAIGEGTTKALTTANLPVHIQPLENFTSEGLLALPELQNMTNKKILIVGGKNGRTLLQEILIKRGALVTKTNAYRRIRPILAAELQNILQSFAFDVIVSTSMESLQNLLSYFDKAKQTRLMSKSLLVISQRMQQEALNIGFNQIILAENAKDESILKALIV